MTFREFHELRLKYVWEQLTPVNREEVEATVEKRMVDYLSTWFTVHTQKFDDTGKHKCDIIMYHKATTEREVPIIIEIKREDVKRGQSMGEWCKQAKRYADTTWHGGKKAIVIIFPQISGYYFEEGCLVNQHDVTNHEHHNINSFLYGAFELGELRDFYHHEKKGYAIIVNNKILWQSHEGFNFHLKRLPRGY